MFLLDAIEFFWCQVILHDSNERSSMGSLTFYYTQTQTHMRPHTHTRTRTRDSSVCSPIILAIQGVALQQDMRKHRLNRMGARHVRPRNKALCHDRQINFHLLNLSVEQVVLRQKWYRAWQRKLLTVPRALADSQGGSKAVGSRTCDSLPTLDGVA